MAWLHTPSAPGQLAYIDVQLCQLAIRVRHSARLLRLGGCLRSACLSCCGLRLGNFPLMALVLEKGCSRVASLPQALPAALQAGP